MVMATMAICILSFMVWLHHFFTMGAGANVNAFFGIMTMIIAIPTGVKVFNWLFTLYGGRIRFEVPVLWAIGFMVTFVIGGLSGVLMAVPPADFVLHNSLFLVAHFHNVIIGGVLFGAMAGYNYWFPKVFGFTLDKRLGQLSFWCWLIGFYLAFMPLYVLGLFGMTRRMQHYADTSWQPYLIVAEVGAIVILCGILASIAQLVVSIRDRDRHRDLTGDPWDGRTLEWSTASPPPRYNFAVMPSVESRDAFAHMKANGTPDKIVPEHFEPIELPGNSPNGFVTAFFAVITGFALIWHIWWMALLGIACALVTLLVFGWFERVNVEISAEELARDARARMSKAEPA
jgi:cytochrome o ubiquinol oxidase subunit I